MGNYCEKLTRDRKYGTKFNNKSYLPARSISRIKPLDTRQYIQGCVYMVDVTRTRPIFDLDRVHREAATRGVRARKKERNHLVSQRN